MHVATTSKLYPNSTIKTDRNHVIYLDMKLDKDLQEQTDRPLTINDVQPVIKEPFVPTVNDDEELFDLDNDTYLIFKKQNETPMWNFTLFVGGGININNA